MTMEELGFPKGTGISPVAVSEPFKLFSDEAVAVMRNEILSDQVWDNCRYTSSLAACQLRGFAPKFARFIYDAWMNDKTLSIISKVAGIDVVPSMDFEIGHVNISVKSAKHAKSEQEAYRDNGEQVLDVGTGMHRPGTSNELTGTRPVVDWHTDAYPFVCVVMLSDASKMVGGETALLTGNGEILKVRSPQTGSAVVLQGRYIQHTALQAMGAAERITMVTSFRPRSPSLPDDTVLETVRGVSDLPELYQQFSEYRLEILGERVRHALKQLREQKRSARKIDTSAVKKFLKEQVHFLTRTDEELVDETDVVQGKV
ncbi:MAG: hypothetical protein M1832_003259 [Thelocarpon impressellum]|nr:MAG: hypothetical protein M1832_003259 [Thelocarpon impressellum]